MASFEQAFWCVQERKLTSTALPGTSAGLRQSVVLISSTIEGKASHHSVMANELVRGALVPRRRVKCSWRSGIYAKNVIALSHPQFCISGARRKPAIESYRLRGTHICSWIRIYCK
jgi:hypothetical protein